MSLIAKRGNYRAAVGPEDKYDLIGGLQFKVLFELGLREWHYMLDIGCGSLRGGRFFIIYLKPYHYFGIEPDKELVDVGLSKELGIENAADHIKRPRFNYNNTFDLKLYDEHDISGYNFILAQSIFSHATQTQILKCLTEVKKCMVRDGMFVATYFRTNGQNSNQAGWGDLALYNEDWLYRKAFNTGLIMSRLNYDHPSGQTWAKFEHLRR